MITVRKLMSWMVELQLGRVVKHANMLDSKITNSAGFLRRSTMSTPF